MSKTLFIKNRKSINDVLVNIFKISLYAAEVSKVMNELNSSRRRYTNDVQ